MGTGKGVSNIPARWSNSKIWGYKRKGITQISRNLDENKPKFRKHCGIFSLKYLKKKISVMLPNFLDKAIIREYFLGHYYKIILSKMLKF